MLRFSANISMLFTEVPMLQRIKLAKKAGFDGIEVQFPYDCNALEFKQALDDANMPLALFNCPAGDLMMGGQGNASVPGRAEEFRQAIELAAEYARILKPQNVNILSGRPDKSLPRKECWSTFVENVETALTVCTDLNVQLLTEVINTEDQPDFFLSTSSQVLELIEHFEPGQLKLQFDVYHIEKMEGEVERKLRELLPFIGHIQFADVPGRGEPGTGSLDFPLLFSAIDKVCYEGFLGAEYLPSGNTVDSLQWLHAISKS